MEVLLAAEIPLARQWSYLERLRDNGIALNVKIPASRPADEEVRKLTVPILKDGKGWGRSAELIELCAVSELPPTITAFLDKIYATFPRPKPPEIPDAEDAETEATAASVADQPLPETTATVLDG